MKYRVVSKTIVHNPHTNKYLCTLYRDNDDMLNIIDVPGGGLEVTESPYQCAWRELKEETGLYSDDCYSIKYLGQINYEYQSKIANDAGGIYVVGYVFLVQTDQRKVISGDNEILAWLDFDELPKLYQQLLV